ncbi:MAG: SIMPL domain-containing protein [Rhodospirillales bacterium]
MRWLPLVPLLAATAATAAEPPAVTVQGTCTASAQPDRARIFVGAETSGPDASRVAAAAITQYNRFRAEVEKLALPDAALTSTGVQTDRSTDERNGRLITTGYTARAGLTVETSSLPGLARVMQAAATDGMANIGSMDLFLSDALRRSLEQSCLPKATADARERAAALLAGVGASLGDVLSISSGEPTEPGPRPVFAPMAMAARAAPTPDLSAGPQTVTVTATVMFAIAPAHK